MILLYPALLVGAAAIVVRRDRPEGRGWVWFAAWLLVGALFAFTYVTSLRLLVLPVAAAALLGVAWLSPHTREASGFLAGIGALAVTLVALA